MFIFKLSLNISTMLSDCYLLSSFSAYWWVWTSMSFISWSLVTSFIVSLPRQTDGLYSNLKIEKISRRRSSLRWSMIWLSSRWMTIRFGQVAIISQRCNKLLLSNYIPEMSKWCKRSVSSKKRLMSLTNFLEYSISIGFVEKFKVL